MQKWKDEEQIAAERERLTQEYIKKNFPNGEVLALYEVQQGRLRRAKMFYFDSSAVAEFLAGSPTDQPYEFSKEETRDHAGEPSCFLGSSITTVRLGSRAE